MVTTKCHQPEGTKSICPALRRSTHAEGARMKASTVGGDAPPSSPRPNPSESEQVAQSFSPQTRSPACTNK